jgi:hypothetical protein
LGGGLGARSLGNKHKINMKKKNQIEELAKILWRVHSHSLNPFYKGKQISWNSLEMKTKNKNDVDKMFFLEMAEEILKTKLKPSQSSSNVTKKSESHTDYGIIEGNLEIKTIEENNKVKIMIYGDERGLSSLGNLLNHLAKQNQDKLVGLPIGEREHIHISPNYHLSKSSNETIIGRSEANGTGEFPSDYVKRTNSKKKK